MYMHLWGVGESGQQGRVVLKNHNVDGKSTVSQERKRNAWPKAEEAKWRRVKKTNTIATGLC